jgi:hypothetical protein
MRWLGSRPRRKRLRWALRTERAGFVRASIFEPEVAGGTAEGVVDHVIDAPCTAMSAEMVVDPTLDLVAID